MSLGSGNQVETRKIFCAYHKTQFLTNFCLQKECLMPLCPSCVVQHTQQHYQSSQKPTYVNLAEVLQDVKQKCYAQIITLQEYNKKNDQLLKYRENFSQNIHNQLTQCKQEIYLKIEHMFQKYQTKILKQIQQRYTENNLYDQEEANQISQYINQQIQTLYDKIGILKSQHCLAALIRFYDHEQEQFEEAMRDVHSYLQKHKKMGRPHISLNNQLLNEKLQGLCQQLLMINYVPLEEQEVLKNSKLKKGGSTTMITPVRKESYARINSSAYRQNHRLY